MGEVQVFDTTTGDSVLDNWSTLYCEEFVDQDKSFGLAKLLYIPRHEFNIVYDWVIAEVSKNKLFNDVVDKVKSSSTYIAFTKHEKVLQANLQATKLYEQVSEQVKARTPEHVKKFVFDGEVHFNKMCVAKKN
ncbi:unnamed protein product [Ambrosiozyma monospora]|uniref:Unnamed protein product n=1 Tax=Ambrosiozyma monospora TaxID=43982 RepID=A0ACB5TLC7_AMBMO|nr:unnamed protein product [Ambrosiozyma monospora]